MDRSEYTANIDQKCAQPSRAQMHQAAMDDAGFGNLLFAVLGFAATCAVGALCVFYIARLF